MSLLHINTSVIMSLLHVTFVIMDYYDILLQ